MNNEIKKEEEVKETLPQETVTPVETTPEGPKKKGSGKSVLVIVLVVLGVLAVLGVAVFYLVVNFVVDKAEEVQETFREIEQVDDLVVFDEDPLLYDDEGEMLYDDEGEMLYDEDMSTDYPRVDNELTDQDLISESFPSEEIPLSGGRVISSSYDQWSTVVDISTSSSVADTYKWYEEALEGTEWEITTKSREDETALIQFDNGLNYGEEEYRQGEITIHTWEWIDYTTVTVRERF